MCPLILILLLFFLIKTREKFEGNKLDLYARDNNIPLEALDHSLDMTPDTIPETQAETLPDHLMFAPAPEPDIKYRHEVPKGLSMRYNCNHYNWNNKATRPCYKNGRWMCCGNNDPDRWYLKDEDVEIEDGGECRGIYGFAIDKWREVKGKPGVCYIERSQFPNDSHYFAGQPACRYTDRTGRYCITDFNKEETVQGIGDLLEFGKKHGYNIL